MSTNEPLIIPDPGALIIPSDKYTALSVQQTQDITEGGIEYDVADIYFTVTGRPGVFSVQYPFALFSVLQYGLDLTSDARLVEQLFEL